MDSREALKHLSGTMITSVWKNQTNKALSFLQFKDKKD